MRIDECRRRRVRFGARACTKGLGRGNMSVRLCSQRSRQSNDSRRRISSRDCRASLLWSARCQSLAHAASAFLGLRALSHGASIPTLTCGAPSWGASPASLTRHDKPWSPLSSPLQVAAFRKVARCGCAHPRGGSSAVVRGGTGRRGGNGSVCACVFLGASGRRFCRCSPAVACPETCITHPWRNASMAPGMH